MVAAGERGFDKTPQEKGSRLKNAKGYTLREQQLIARFGKSVLHPLCQVALRFWQTEAEYSALMKKALEAKKFRDDFKEQRKKAARLASWFSDNKREEVEQAAAVLKKIDNEFLPKAQKLYEANLEFLSAYDWDLVRAVACALFDQECDKYKGDNQAQKALQRTQKRWDEITNGKPLKPSDARKFGILRALHDKKIKATSAIEGPAAGYLEAGTGGDRSLSDETWQGRLTARELHEHLKSTKGAAVAGDNEAKEIRRDAKKLRIRLAEDQCGRKWKGPFLKTQKANKPRGRPREKVELIYAGDTSGVEAAVAKKYLGTHRAADSVREKDAYSVASARKDSASVEKEIKQLMLCRGGRRDDYVS
jgi:hypothetical protein